MSLSIEAVLAGYLDDKSGNLHSKVAQDITLDRAMLKSIKSFINRYKQIKLPNDFDELYVFVKMHRPMMLGGSKEAYHTRFDKCWVNFPVDNMVCRLALEAYKDFEMDEYCEDYPVENWVNKESRERVLNNVRYWILWLSMYATEHEISMRAEEKVESEAERKIELIKDNKAKDSGINSNIH